MNGPETVCGPAYERPRRAGQRTIPEIDLEDFHKAKLFQKSRALERRRRRIARFDRKSRMSA